jgi:GNAT superfamily N-acetyltransferase
MRLQVDARDFDGKHECMPSRASAAVAPVEFRPFVISDTAEAIRLLSIGKPDDYAPRKRSVFEWQFLRNPHSDGRAPFLVGTTEGRIVALNGFMPARLQFNGTVVDACWSCDTFVSSELRGKGIGKKLINHVTSAAGVMLGYGISDLSDPIFNKFEWLLHPEVELVFRHVSERGVVGAIKNAASRVASLRGIRVHGAEHETWDSLCATRMRELDELWARNAAGYCSAVTRDGAYLRWKYFEHPLHRYRAYAMREENVLTAVLFVRHDAEESVIADYSGPATAEDKIASLALAIIDDASKVDATRIKW